VDHSVNDNQDFAKLDHHLINGEKKADGERINKTYGMVISQLRALESAPALLFNQFEGLMNQGYGSGEKDANGLYVGFKSATSKTNKCFDLRLGENKYRFDLPNHTNCWNEPRWVAQGKGAMQGESCHYIDDGAHNVWCFNPLSSAPWHIEDTTGVPIADRGLPSMSMRNIVWPKHDEVPDNILQLWNGCGHPARCSDLGSILCWMVSTNCSLTACMSGSCRTINPACLHHILHLYRHKTKGRVRTQQHVWVDLVFVGKNV
jgi:hypothetical protein